MNADLLHDAISLLPDALLEPVDAMRQKKHVPWKSIAALAACACLVVGLWSLFPGNKKAEGNAGCMAPDKGFINNSSSVLGDCITQESASSCYLSAIVLEAAEDYITVLPDNQTINMSTPITVTFESLDSIPELKSGQRIKVYCKEFPEGNQPLVPYRIEIIDE